VSAVRFRVLRLHPGDDLRGSLEDWTRASGVAAAFVAAAVGSLAVAQLRFAGRDAATRIDGPLELLVLSGTLSPDGAHLHASVADADGRMSGGHVLPGCTIRTTAEIVVGVLPDLAFGRGYDPATGYHELLVRRRSDR
jgi:predicted DNA-binding protein with PD1-like motif